MKSLAELVAEARSGDRAAMGELYDRFARLVRSICYDTTLDLDQAEELAQEVFLRAFGKLHQLRRPERFAPWLVGISRRLCRDWQRGRVRSRGQVDVTAADVAAPAIHETNGRIDDLRQAIAKLPRRERLAMHIFYLDEQPAEAARATLGLSQSGFYKLLARARGRLKTAMQENERERR